MLYKTKSTASGAGKMSFAPSDPAPGAVKLCVAVMDDDWSNYPPMHPPRNKALLTIGFP